MIKEICVIGHPSMCGGADTELHDQIKCWYKMGIKTYLLHTAPIAAYFKSMKLTENYGCEYLRPRMWDDCKDMHTISFCNGEFLTNIESIKKYARTTTFVNCMTWNFEKEISAQRRGLLDFHLYQTQHGYDMISKKLIPLGAPYRPYIFNPYFDSSEFKSYPTRDNDHFRFGRISRADLAKYNKHQFIIYDNINSDIPKSGVVVGWNARVTKKCLIDGKDLKKKNDQLYYKDYIQLIPESGVQQKPFYKFCDVMVCNSDTFENLPRVGFECMASGTIPVVDNRGGWTIQIDDGENGFLCDTTYEFIERCNLLANNSDLRFEMRHFGFEKLKNNWSLDKSMGSWSEFFMMLESLK